MEVIFWTTVALVFYLYGGYPILLLAVSRVRPRPVAAAPITPNVSLIVSVHNAESIIREKIANCLSLDYPAERLEILVASDGSSDATNDRVREIVDPRVKLVTVAEHRGKEHAQREAIARSGGDIIVFTDAAIQTSPRALRAITSDFADPAVGCVSGIDQLLKASGETVGEGVFVRFENLLKRFESRIGSIVGNSGWLFAVRRSLCDAWPEEMASDFAMVLRTVKRGFRAVVEPGAVGYALATPSRAAEFERKVRTMVRGMVVLAAHKEMLNPFRFGFFSLQLLSHKLFRWLLPFLLIFVFLSNLVLAFDSRFYQGLLMLQATFYAVGMLLPGARVPQFLLGSCLAAAVAWWKFVKGERFVVWNATPREWQSPKTEIQP